MDGHGKGLFGLLVWPRGLERSAVKRDIAFRLGRHLVSGVTIEADGVRFYLDTSDRVVSREVFIYGMYERPLMAAAVAALGELGLPSCLRGRWLLDVGANIGTASLTAIRHFGAAGTIAFEPDPRNQRILRINRAMNDLDERIVAFEVAVSDANGTVMFERSSWNWGDNRVRVDGASATQARELDEEGREVIEVPTAPLGGVLADNDLDLERCGLAWIDVQGHEGHVLSGAPELLSSDIPLVVEYWPYGLRAADGLERFERLVRDSYDYFVDLRPAGGGSPVPREVREIEEVGRSLSGSEDDTDLLLVPRSLLSRG
jgi:FkbM family methyltransferase